MSRAIDELVEMALHDQCKAKHPKLYAVIASLVAVGQTASQIEAEIVRRNPARAGTLTADMVRYTAEVLERRRSAMRR